MWTYLIFEQLEEAWLFPDTILPDYLDPRRDELMEKQYERIQKLINEMGEEKFGEKYPYLAELKLQQTKIPLSSPEPSQNEYSQSEPNDPEASSP